MPASPALRAAAALLLVLGTVAVPLAAPADAQAGDASWTVLVYMLAEGTLEDAAISNMLEMQGVGAGPHARVLVQLDRGPDYATEDGDWESTRRYEVTVDPVPAGDGDRLTSRLLSDMGEVNMGDPDALKDFLAWGVATAPAEHYLVIPWNHGAAWEGVAFDESPEDHLTLTELGAALDESRRAAGVGAWDVVYFDACVMGALEVAHAVGSSARFVIASEELVPGLGGAYDAMMEAVHEPDMSPEELAGRLVNAFAARYAGEAGTGADGHACFGACGSVTFDAAYNVETDNSAILSWYDLAHEPALWSAWQAFDQAITEHADAEWPTLVRAARDADRYEWPDSRNQEAMDIGDFAARVRGTTSEDAIRVAADDVLDALDAFVKGYTTSPNHRTATGVMVAFPVPSSRPMGDASPAGATTGSGSLSAAAADGDTTAPTFGEIAVFEDEDGLWFTVPVHDRNAYAIDLAITDEESAFGEVMAWLPPSDVEETADGLVATFEFDGFVFALVGEETESEWLDLAAAYFESLDAVEYTLDGIYRHGASGEEEDAFLVFDLDGEFLSAWIVGDAASEVTPRPGDAFAPTSLGWEDDEPIDVYDAFVPAARGDTPWHLERVALPGGATGFYAFAEDLAGNAALSEGIELDLPDLPEEWHETDDTSDGDADPDTDAEDPADAQDEGDADTPGAPLALVIASVAAVALVAGKRRT